MAVLEPQPFVHVSKHSVWLIPRAASMRKIKSKMEFLKAKIDWVSSPSTSLTDCSCDNFCVGQHWKPVKATEESFQSKIHPQFRCRLSGNLDELERIKRPLKLLVLGFSNSTQTGHPGLGQHIHPYHCCIHSTFPATEKLENLPKSGSWTWIGSFFVSFWFVGWESFPVLPGEGGSRSLRLWPLELIWGFIYIPYSVCSLEWAGAQGRAASSLQTAQVKHRMFLWRGTWTSESSGRFWQCPSGAGHHLSSTWWAGRRDH